MTMEDCEMETTIKIEEAAPNHTIYIKNLNDKIKLDRMKKSLYSSFSQHGKILEIVMSSARRLRGQAWITFDDIPSATNAMRAMQSFILFEKPLVIQYGKEKADIIARREGTYEPREKRKLDPNADAKAAKKAAMNGQNGVPPPPPPPKLPKVHQNIPNKILFLQELPESCTEEMLSLLFKQYHGFKEVRLVPSKKGLAFVEFGDEAQAAIALQGLYGFKLTPTEFLHVSFAKK